MEWLGQWLKFLSLLSSYCQDSTSVWFYSYTSASSTNGPFILVYELCTEWHFCCFEQVSENYFYDLSQQLSTLTMTSPALALNYTRIHKAARPLWSLVQVFAIIMWNAGWSATKRRRTPLPISSHTMMGFLWLFYRRCGTSSMLKINMDEKYDTRKWGNFEGASFLVRTSIPHTQKNSSSHPHPQRFKPQFVLTKMDGHPLFTHTYTHIC